MPFRSRCSPGVTITPLALNTTVALHPYCFHVPAAPHGVHRERRGSEAELWAWEPFSLA
jgi:hypothetical protein